MTGPSESDPEASRRRGERLLAERRFDEALSLFDAALSQRPDDPDLLNDRGRALNNLRRLPEAAEAFERAIELRPDFAVAHNNLGHVMRALGELTRAEEAFSRATLLDPDFARAHHNLGTVCAARGDYDRAAACFRRGLELEPDDVSGYINLGEVLQFLVRYDEALEVYERGLGVAEDRAELHASCGVLQHSLGQLEAAMRSYRRALELEPDNSAALAGRALLEEIMGRADEGWSLIGPRITAGTNDPGLLHAAGRLLRRRRRHDEALSLLLPLRERTDSFWSRSPDLYYTLGEIYDELGMYEEAFEHYARANDLKPVSFDPHAHRRQITRMIEYFSAGRLRSLPRAEPCEVRPVFIIGMPRSGTTLVEQILASHTQVHAGGERRELPLVIRELDRRFGAGRGYPECLTDLTAQDVTGLRDTYLDGLGTIPSGATCFTDKRPWNFLHLGLVGLLFPGARVVHCVRDPLDTALSVFFQNLNARTDPYATNLEHIAAYYREYRRITKHWAATSELPMFELRYERLVEDQEALTRQLLAFVDLGWEAQCLRFYETRRLVDTASYAQVRRPIYRSSVGRHRHYARHLAAIADQLR